MRILLLNLKKNFAFDFFVIKLIIEAQKSTHTLSVFKAFNSVLNKLDHLFVQDKQYITIRSFD